MLYAFLVVALAALAYGATLEEQWAEYKVSSGFLLYVSLITNFWQSA